MEINVDNREYYEFGKPEKDDQTKSRLLGMKKMGMIDFGNFQFGVDGVVSGIWIERVWSFSNKDWKSYMEWAQSVIDKKK